MLFVVYLEGKMSANYRASLTSLCVQQYTLGHSTDFDLSYIINQWRYQYM